MQTSKAGWWTTLPPVAGGAVMATAIISVGLHLTGHDLTSRVAFALAGAMWLVLAAAFVGEASGDFVGWMMHATTPTALTSSIATAVLGTRASLAGWQVVAEIALIAAVILWPPLLCAVWRHRNRPAPGADFLIAVAPQALAVLAITLALAGQGRWLAYAGLGLFVFGLLLYADAFRRFERRQILIGFGDHWIVAGSVAIAALAAARLTSVPWWTGTSHQLLRVTTIVLVAIALAGYAVLVVAEIRCPRPHYDIRRWATIFPLGMTAVMCLTASLAVGIGWLLPLGRVLLWIAVAVWLVTAYGLVATETARSRAS